MSLFPPRSQVNDLSDFVEALSQGVAQRATAATRMNINSSRSHAVLTVNVRIEPIGGGARAGTAPPVSRAWLQNVFRRSFRCITI